MCGIAGIARATRAPVDRVVLERMCEAQAHRGPDARGLHFDDGVGLGIQRLRVIDLVTGDQPIHNEDRTVTVVLNGEIYNFPELRRRLRANGHRFATEGDTEVIVHLYEELGPACVRELHGMFAFALWDSRRHQLLLARDRVGKKPLFYCERPGALSFASELWALTQDPDVPREIDHHALDAYLAYGYVPAPASAFAAVRKLMPATTLTYREGVVETERYWRLDYSRKRTAQPLPEVHEEIRAGIRQAVRRRMIADVPTGAFLSGGVDSAAVVAAMAESSSAPVKTFSIGFEDERYNELPLAQRTAREFATEHHELIVRPDAIEILPKVVRHYGEPFADASAIPSFYLARFARDHVTVALNGDGGDESFAGYQRYTTNLALAELDRLPLGPRRAVSAAARRAPLGHDRRSLRSRLGRFALASGLDRERRYIAQQSVFTATERHNLYTPDYSALLGSSRTDAVLLDPWRSSTATQLLDQLLDVDVNTYLPGDLLAKIDIATMAYSLEGRSPLLDHELMELAASLPPELKAGRGRRKRILRSALRGWVPDEILDAPKRGFELPVARWFRGELRDYTREVLLDTSAISRGWCREAEVCRLLDEHANGTRDHGRGIWRLLMLELWYQGVSAVPSQISSPRAPRSLEGAHLAGQTMTGGGPQSPDRRGLVGARDRD
jgi:asparagine synthase (glutamine-hydrolysing)